VVQIDCVVFDIGNVLVRWDPRNLYRRLGYADPETAAILAEVGLLEINHRILDAGGQFAATLELLVERFSDLVEAGCEFRQLRSLDGSELGEALPVFRARLLMSDTDDWVASGSVATLTSSSDWSGTL